MSITNSHQGKFNVGVTVICGPNEYARSRELNTRTAEFVAAYGEIGLEPIDGETVTAARLREALTSLPFLAEKKMVVVKNLSSNKPVLEEIDALLAEVPDTTDAVFVESKVDKRSAYYKLLKKQPSFIECEGLDQAALARWAVAYAKEKSGSLSTTDANYLIGRLGDSQQLLASEIDKLLLYNSTITRQSIDLLTEPTPSSTVFELLGAAFEGRTKAAIGIYEEQRRLRVEPQAILALIAWQLHLLSLIKTAKDRSSADIARAAGVSPFAVGRSMTIARQISVSRLKELIHEALTLDARLKSETIDTDGAMKNLIIKIAA